MFPLDDRRCVASRCKSISYRRIVYTKSVVSFYLKCKIVHKLQIYSKQKENNINFGKKYISIVENNIFKVTQNMPS